MESHSFTCHSYTNHTCLCSPAARRHHPLAGIHCASPLRESQAELTSVAGYISRWMSFIHSFSRCGTFISRELNLDTFTPASTNWAQRRLTLLIKSNVLPLSHHSPLAYHSYTVTKAYIGACTMGHTLVAGPQCWLWAVIPASVHSHHKVTEKKVKDIIRQTLSWCSCLKILIYTTAGYLGIHKMVFDCQGQRFC